MNLNEIKNDRDEMRRQKIQDIKNDQQRFINDLQKCFTKQDTCSCNIEKGDTHLSLSCKNDYFGLKWNSSSCSVDIFESVLPDIEKSGINISYTNILNMYNERELKIDFTLPK